MTSLKLSFSTIRPTARQLSKRGATTFARNGTQLAQLEEKTDTQPEKWGLVSIGFHTAPAGDRATSMYSRNQSSSISSDHNRCE
jgi:hypothetical protein